MPLLCQHCHLFKLPSLNDENDHCFDIPLDILLRGFASGCALCVFLGQVIQDDPEARYTVTHYSDQCYVELRFESTSSLQIRDNNKNFNWMCVRVAPRFPYQPINPNGRAKLPFTERNAGVQFYLFADAGSAAAMSGDVSGRYVGKNPDSPEYYDTIRAWIQDCQCSEQHTSCSLTFSRTSTIDANNAKLPTRCIEVFDEYFILRKTSGTIGTYITLSHRWNAQTEECKTMPSNYESRLKGEAINTLPRTFQDAIRVTRKLGYRFLWIDSLCIIQTRGDWSRESLKMAEYYQGAVFNISATEASTTGGFLSPHLYNSSIRLSRLPYVDIDGQMNGYFYLRRESPRHIVNSYKASVSESSLLKRGWVYQEWLLSRRTIYFTPNHVFFECQSSPPITTSLHEIRLQEVTFKQDMRLDTKRVADQWYEIVSAYSQLQLTKSADRIAALSGIASEIRQALKKKDEDNLTPHSLNYVAGLWVRDLHYGLMWECEASSIEEADRQFPSWSWSSMRSPVTWRSRSSSIQPAAAFLQLQAEKPQTGNVYLTSAGTPTSSSYLEAFDVDNCYTILTLKANVLEVIPGGILERTTLATFVANATFETHEDARNQKMNGWHGISSPTHPGIVVGWGKFGQCEEIPYATVFALHIYTSRAPGGFLFGYCNFTHPVYHVILCVHVVDNIYRRVGTGRFFAKEVVQEFSQNAAQIIRLT